MSSIPVSRGRNQDAPPDQEARGQRSYYLPPCARVNQHETPSWGRLRLVVDMVNKKKWRPAETWRARVNIIPEWRVYYFTYQHFADLLVDLNRDPLHTTDRMLQELQSAIILFMQFYNSQERSLRDSLKRWSERQSRETSAVAPLPVPEDAAKTGKKNRVVEAGGLGLEQDTQIKIIVTPVANNPLTEGATPSMNIPILPLPETKFITPEESDRSVRRQVDKIEKLLKFAAQNIETVRKIAQEFDLLVRENKTLRKGLVEVLEKKKLLRQAEQGTAAAPAQGDTETEVPSLEHELTECLGGTRLGHSYVRLHPLLLVLTDALGAGRKADGPETGKSRWTMVGRAYLGSRSFGADKLAKASDAPDALDAEDSQTAYKKLSAALLQKPGASPEDVEKQAAVADTSTKDRLAGLLTGAERLVKRTSSRDPQAPALGDSRVPPTAPRMMLNRSQGATAEGFNSAEQGSAPGVISHRQRHIVVNAMHGLFPGLQGPEAQKRVDRELGMAQVNIIRALDKLRLVEQAPSLSIATSGDNVEREVAKLSGQEESMIIVHPRGSFDADDVGDSDVDENEMEERVGALKAREISEENWRETIYAELFHGTMAFAIVMGAILGGMYQEHFFPLFQQNAHKVPEWQPYLVIWTTAICLKLLVEGKESDVVLVFATLFLCLTNVLSLQEAWAGFSNDVVLSVAVLGVVAQGVERTGAVEKIFLALLGKPRGFKMATLRLMAPAIVMNVGMSNTANMSILMPIIEKWSMDIGISKNMFLMPLSFCLLISGTVAIFATSSNLIAQGQMEKYGEVPFTTFEIAPVSIGATLGTLLVVIFLMEPLFPDFQAETKTALENGEEENANEDVEGAHDGAAAAMIADGDHAGQGENGTTNGNGFHRSSSLEIQESAVKKQKHKDTKRYLVSVQLMGDVYADQKVREVDFLDRNSLGAELIAVERFGQSKDLTDPKFVFKNYDVVILYTSSSQLVKLYKNPGTSLLTRDIGDPPVVYRMSDAQEICEVVLDSSCPLVNQRICPSTEVRKRYGARVLGLRPLGLTQSLKGTLSVSFDEKKVRKTVFDYTQQETRGLRYKPGDTLLLMAREGFAERHERDGDFFGVRVIVDEDEQQQKLDEKTEAEADVEAAAAPEKPAGPSVAKQVASIAILLCMVYCVSTNTLPLLTACMTASFALTYTDCMTKDQAFKAIKIRTVLTIVGAFGLGDAIGNTKVAYLLATYVTDAMAPFGTPGLLVGIYVVVLLLGIVFHATAVVILMFPVCLESAKSLDVPVHQAVCILMIGAGCQMLSPVSYQTNLMAFSAGSYSFNDFPKLGLPIVILIGLICVPLTMICIE